MRVTRTAGGYERWQGGAIGGAERGTGSFSGKRPRRGRHGIYGGAGRSATECSRGCCSPKGKEVRLQPGAIFRIKFTKPLTLPVIETPGSPKPIIQDPPVSSDPSGKPPQ